MDTQEMIDLLEDVREYIDEFNNDYINDKLDRVIKALKE